MSHPSSRAGIEAAVKHQHEVGRVIFIEPPDMTGVVYVIPLPVDLSGDGIRDAAIQLTVDFNRSYGVVMNVLGADDIEGAVLDIAKHAARQERLRAECLASLVSSRDKLVAIQADLALPRWVRWLVGYFRKGAK